MESYLILGESCVEEARLEQGYKTGVLALCILGQHYIPLHNPLRAIGREILTLPHTPLCGRGMRRITQGGSYEFRQCHGSRYRHSYRYCARSASRLLCLSLVGEEAG